MDAVGRALGSLRRSHWPALGAVLIAIGVVALPAAGQPRGDADRRPHLYADTVYLNGNVITMGAGSRKARAVAVRDGRIVAVGSDSRVRPLVGRETHVVNLRWKSLLPGFVDAHSHFPGAGVNELFQANLSAPPAGPVRDIDDLVMQLRGKLDDPAYGEWVRGRGFDQAQLPERRFPTKDDLDRVSTEQPVWAGHSNGHMGVANSKALALAGIDENGPDDDRIIRDPETGEPTGLLLEGAQGRVTSLIPSVTDEQRTAGVKRAVELYTAAGVTTSVMPSCGRTGMRRLQGWRSEGLLPLRFTCDYYDDNSARMAGLRSGFGDEWLRVGGYGEQVYDGSIQGWTGYLKEPYHTVPDWYPADWRGFPNYSKSTLFNRVRAQHEAGWQTAIHANGDQAIEDLLDAIESAQEELGDWDARHRIEHAQMATPDQLRRMKQLGVSPSFFVSHTFYWGDEHRDIFIGPDRAARISPLKSASDLGIPYSIHLDSPVVPMSPLQAVWSAVNRLTRTGKVLGPAERVDPMTALRAVTIDAAWQNHEEKIKGSIEVGKLADFVILESDPLTIDRTKIRDIEVDETIVGGQSVFRRP